MLSSTPQQILQSPVNDSTAKYHWSFAKSQRFTKYRTNCPVVFYEIPNTKSKRGTSFGNGSRVDFELTTDSPSPYLYNTISQFDDNKNKKKGTGFAKNRQQCKEQGYIKTGPLKNPGPGEYATHQNKTLQYSMRPKTSYPREYFISDIQKMMTPGPGTYEETITIINPKGSVTSKLRNPNRTTLGFTSQRFKNERSTPGPGHYDDKNVMKTGDYMLSINRSAGKRVFSHDKRELKLDGNRETPGPGSYRKPSDFGHYEKPYTSVSSRKNSSRPTTAKH